MKTRNNKGSGSVGRRLFISVFLIMAVLLLAYLAGSVSFTTSPTITPGSPDTTANLICSWNASGDTTQENVTWYNNSVSYRNETDPAGSQSLISSTFTKRGDIWNCTVTLSNGTNTTNQWVNVSIDNAPPTKPVMVNSTGQDIGNITNVTEDIANVFNLTSTDPDGDKVTYGNYDSLPDGASLNSNTGVFTWTPDYNNTDVNLTFYAKDNQTPFANTNKFIMFFVVYVNDAPQFNPALTNQNINESQVFNYNISATDEENNVPLNFSINVTPFLNLTVNITSNTTALIMFVNNRSATYGEAGNYTVNITVYDSLGANTTESFNLEIGQVNVAPVLNAISNQSGTQGGVLLFNVSANDQDVNDTLNFTIVPTVCTITNPWSITTTNSSNNATSLVNVTSLTNNHIICRQVRITVVDDDGAEGFQDVFLNISNTNDPPNVEVLSSHSNNTDGDNISDLISYAESPFFYKVNATDIDNDTYEGENLTFSNNATFMFNISSTTGIVSFTATQGDIGNHTINITVTDDGGLIDNEIMYFEIRNNSAPAIVSPGDQACTEDSLCTIVVTATDDDNDNLTFSSNNTGVFNLTDNASQNPTLSALVNYTPLQSHVGNYSILITSTDVRGAFDNETINFEISNFNDDPVLQGFSFPKVVATHVVSIYVFASDEDYDLINTYENLTFNDNNLSGSDLFNISTTLNTSNNQTYGRIIFTPSPGDIGNYSVNISVTDFYGETDYVVKNFTVHNTSRPPNITAIRPYGTPYSNQTIFNLTNRSNYAGNSTAINFSENQDILYNVTVTDEVPENLTYYWYIDGVLNSSGTSLTITHNYFSEGDYNVTVLIADDMYENISWTWNVTVDDINRGPMFLNTLSNQTVNTTTTFSNFLLWAGGGMSAFIDPDDDINGDNFINITETSNLNYNVTDCSVATISITNHDVKVEPEEVGTCNVTFLAYDAGSLTNISNVITFNITSVPNATDETPTPSSSSGGGSSTSKSIIIPIKEQEDILNAIEIIVPELVTVYRNETVLIPINIQNNWNTSLLGVQINVSTNASYVELSLTQDYFNEVKVNEKKNITLIVNNYRLGENYEIRINANVTTPQASDSALVLLNSIEQSEEGEDVETKVTFAQDLLNENPECLELNELLTKAKDVLNAGSTEEASDMVDSVINGCKYLVSISRKAEQAPESIVTKLFQKENIKYFLMFLGAMGLIIVLALVLKKGKSNKKEVKEEPKEEETKPYWPT